MAGRGRGAGTRVGGAAATGFSDSASSLSRRSATAPPAGNDAAVRPAVRADGLGGHARVDRRPLRQIVAHAVARQGLREDGIAVRRGDGDLAVPPEHREGGAVRQTDDFGLGAHQAAFLRMNVVGAASRRYWETVPMARWAGQYDEP